MFPCPTLAPPAAAEPAIGDTDHSMENVAFGGLASTGTIFVPGASTGEFITVATSARTGALGRSAILP